ncbi:MAG TPA: hypothetical protein VNC41_15100 [Acidimicrobiia bacterium]|nr:hypothetical protein [Acidimicrobiia bacterium]
MQQDELVVAGAIAEYRRGTILSREEALASNVINDCRLGIAHFGAPRPKNRMSICFGIESASPERLSRRRQVHRDDVRYAQRFGSAMCHSASAIREAPGHA